MCNHFQNQMMWITYLFVCLSLLGTLGYAIVCIMDISYPLLNNIMAYIVKQVYII